jgi:hypothetical protein
MGLVLAKHWSLAPIVQAVIGAHHEGAPPPQFRAMVDLVRASDLIVNLLMKEAALRPEHLAVIPLLAKGEAPIVMDTVATIGQLVASLSESPPAPPGAEPKSQVDRVAAPRPTAGVRETKAALKVMRGKQEIPGVCARITWSGLEFLVKLPLQENYLTKISVTPESGAPFEIHARVLSSSQSKDGYACEAQLFALSGGAKTRWMDFVKGPDEPKA